MARLPARNRIRSVAFAETNVVATTVALTGVIASHVFQDDVTIVGAQLAVEWQLEDAHVNADGSILTRLELTRQAAAELPGGILLLKGGKVWSAAIVIGGDGNSHATGVMYADGNGVEVDEGESVNIVGTLSWVGAGGTVTTIVSGLVYYVER